MTAKQQTHADPREELPEHLPAMRAFAISLTRKPQMEYTIKFLRGKRQGI